MWICGSSEKLNSIFFYMFLLYKAKNQFGGGSWLFAKEELSSAISKEYIFDDNIQKQPPEKATLLKKRLWHRCFNF